MGNTLSFTYSPISGDEIRLLKILPTSSSEKICCSISHFQLSSCPAYTALSYTWGGSFWTHIIELNGCEFVVRSNLHAFLKEAQERFTKENLTPELGSDIEQNGNSSVWFWIDAICINQEDIPERNAQVLRMKDIYEKAERIICWLGSLPFFTDGMAAIKLLDFFYDLSQKYSNINDHSHAEAIITDSLGSTSHNFKQMDWISLKNMLHRPWWTRAWVVQEASTPRRKVIWYGPYERSSKHFWKAARVLFLISKQPGITQLQKEAYNPSASLFNHMRVAREENKLLLLDALPSMRLYQATDPRDRVFAILAICQDGKHPDIAPHYENSTEEVFTNLAAHILSRDERLDILGHCHYSRRAPSLPTWVPDWTSKWVALDFSHRNEKTLERVYNACFSIPAVIRIDLTTRTLRLRGIKFDELFSVGLARNADPNITPDVDVLRNWLSLASRLGNDYISGGTVFEALQHTLCADITESSQWNGEDERGGKVDLPGDIYTIPQDFFRCSLLLNRRTVRRCLATTRKGYLALAPQETKPGDLLCVLYGGQLPFVLRNSGSYFELIGEAYVHGIMDGESINSSNIRNMEQEFEIH
ncbi:Heterokaryon incompatibility [Fusarium oxysporum f. sp. vasinfectum]|uniref:Heterokaryon incompatibility domain-containing protein n=1 Tax=Fusarium oxysporum f. sp. vasinfectum 25433 TaxID=1089449 RepID=X0L9K5_FUSOX|nr:hypothetical protein FOTG_14117 [Fusarium oxysporum f. sp. vasinfectum 25433]KAK2670511.1 Heterokaryon incompatibility [Fusarium oxysporum f. sp. vasinfectum]